MDERDVIVSSSTELGARRMLGNAMRAPARHLLLCAKVSIVLGTAAGPGALAFQPLITDDTGTQGTGGNQIELALDREKLRGLGDETRTRTLPLVFTRGITESLDAYLGISHVRIESNLPDATASGRGQPVFGIKWRFYEHERAKLSAAFKPEIRFGTSADDESRGLGNGRNAYSGLIIVTQETGFGAVHFNYGIERARFALESNRDANRHTLHRLSAAPVFEIGERWKLAIDLGIVTNPNRTQKAGMAYTELGTIWLPHKDLELALGIIRSARDGEARSTTLTGGLTYRFR